MSTYFTSCFCLDRLLSPEKYYSQAAGWSNNVYNEDVARYITFILAWAKPGPSLGLVGLWALNAKPNPSLSLGWA